jgi:hypothetical protein
MPQKKYLLGSIGAAWGITGVVLLLSSAAYRLSFLVWGAFNVPFRWYHWLALASCVVFMAHAEGVRGFQQHFSPRVAARARYLREHPQVSHVILAPFFCMGYFHATRRRKIVSMSLTAGILVLVFVVHHVPQPWRGIIDAGVVTGLAWGLVSLFWYAAASLTREDFPYPPEIPGQHEDERSAKKPFSPNDSG